MYASGWGKSKGSAWQEEKARQAVWLLGPSSGVVTGIAKRRVLGPPSGVVAGFVRYGKTAPEGGFFVGC